MGLKESQRVLISFRLALPILVLVNLLAVCVLTAPIDESNVLFHDALEKQQIKGESSEYLARLDENFQDGLEENSGQENETAKPQNRLALHWQLLVSGVKKSMAPTLEYLRLMNRYHSWYRRYTDLEKSLGKGTIKSAIQVMREEYAKANELLIDEVCPVDQTERDFENMDFVYRALRVVINDLERVLNETEAAKRQVDDSNGKVTIKELITEEVDEESINLAMDRVKRTAIKTAKEILKKEAIVLAKMIAVNTATFYLQGAMAESAINSLGYLAPLVGMLSSGDVSLASAYLRDLELRAALNVIQLVNPIPKLSCGNDGESDGGKMKFD